MRLETDGATVPVNERVDPRRALMRRRDDHHRLVDGEWTAKDGVKPLSERWQRKGLQWHMSAEHDPVGAVLARIERNVISAA